MAVLVEGISVVVRKDAIKNKMEGGWERFTRLIPNSTLCHDHEVARVGFLEPLNTQEFVDVLEEHGLCYLVEGKPVDIVIVDQQQGPVIKCDWLQFARFSIDGGKVGAAWLWDQPSMGSGIHMHQGMTIAMPAGWHFKDSLSDKGEFKPNNATSQRRDH